MRCLLDTAADPLSADAAVTDLDAWYAAPRRAWVRLNFVAAADGAASAGGLSAALGGPADRQVFSVLRGLSDVILAGAATVTAEDYGPARPSAERQAWRVGQGLPPVPRIAVLTRSGELAPDRRLFREDGPRPLLLTTRRGAAEAQRRGVQAETVALDDDLTPGSVVAALRERGLQHVLCEGGPTVAARLLAAGVVDELCLTVSPQLIGPGPGRILSGEPWTAPRPLRLHRLAMDETLLFAQYRTDRPAE